MAIEITKRGKLPEVKYSFKCNNCKTEFTATIQDGMVHRDQRDGDSIIVECPVCVYT